MSDIPEMPMSDLDTRSNGRSLKLRCKDPKLEKDYDEFWNNREW